MLRKVRYHHVNHAAIPGFKYRGYSIKMSPVDQELVNVQVTFCSTKDAFCKRTARAVLETKESHLIPVGELPVFLAGVNNTIASSDGKEFPVTRHDANRFAWVWKYFL